MQRTNVLKYYKTFLSELLTMYNKHNSLADCWRYAIRRDTKIRSHLQPIHLRDIEDRPFNTGNCDI